MNRKKTTWIDLGIMAVLLFGKSIIKKHEVFTMKTKEELNKIKEEVNNVNEKLKELTPEELEQVNGGAKGALLMGVNILTSGVRGSQYN